MFRRKRGGYCTWFHLENVVHGREYLNLKDETKIAAWSFLSGKW